jgi:hypothetical protein
MATYSQAKIEIEKRGLPWNTKQIFCTGVIAGIVTSVITNPIWVVKTRMQLQIKEKMRQYQPEHYRGLMNAWRRIVQEEGFPALYKFEFWNDILGIGACITLLLSWRRTICRLRVIDEIFQRSNSTVVFDDRVGVVCCWRSQ